MQTIGTSSADKPGFLEKLIRLAIPAGLIYGGIKLFNAFAPTLISFFDNFWTLLLVGGPAVLLILYAMQNGTFLWMWYKTLCKKLTSWFIKMDPLSFMDRYVDLLKIKKKALEEQIRVLLADRINLSREIESLKANVNSYMKAAEAAKKLNKIDLAAHEAGMAATDKQSVDLYLPILDKTNANLDFLNKLNENWGRSIESLSHTVERKRKEYTMLSTMAKALNKASEFANGDTEANRIYNESVQQLEISVSQKIAFIEDFMNSSKDAMQSMDLDKQIYNDEGLELLDQYSKNGSKVLFENDFSKFDIKIDNKADLFSKAKSTPKTSSTFSPVSGTTVNSSSSSSSEFDNLVN